MLELEHGFRVVDVHTRLDPDAEDVATHGRALSPERLEREMHQAGVVHAVVAPSGHERDESYLRSNNAVARLSVDRPFSAFARLDGPRDPSPTTGARLRNLTASRTEHHTSPGDVERYAYDDRFHGFVLDPAADGLPDEDILDMLDNVGLPVVVQGSPAFPPSTAAETVLGRSFPVVLTSFGGFPLDDDRMRAALDLLDRYDDLYLDTSAVRYRSLLERGLLEHPDRILFGSGAPTIHPNVAVMELLTLDVSEDAMTRAFSKNPARVIPSLAPGGQ
ncbi:amidohydrolase [Haloprofundus marisrubri]|uniref:Amidohydrolase n=1 Tax=Haloprofundus marisrubri TaxID=1514971 RepID=A0A0W1R8S0_9EURY|nr:amidohydrolase family protein [Haloprofundus marisrubri]KTG09690.1 amidohydrolase [Haloprofundus marisrubri]